MAVLQRSQLAERIASGGGGTPPTLTTVTGAFTSSTASSLTTPSSTTPSSGTTAFLVWVLQSDQVTSVTDNKSNTYTKIWESAAVPGDPAKVALFACLGGTGGAGHTFTINGTNIAYCSLFPSYATGYDTVNPWCTIPLVTNSASAPSMTLSCPSLPSSAVLMWGNMISSTSSPADWNIPSGWSTYASQLDTNYWTGAICMVSMTNLSAANYTISGSNWFSVVGGIIGLRGT